MTCTEAAVEPYPAGGTAQVYAGLVDVVAVSKGAVHGCGPGCQHRESHLAHFHPHFRPRASRSSYDDAHHNNLALLHVSKAFWLDTDWVRAAVRAPAPTKGESAHTVYIAASRPPCPRPCPRGRRRWRDGVLTCFPALLQCARARWWASAWAAWAHTPSHRAACSRPTECPSCPSSCARPRA